MTSGPRVSRVIPVVAGNRRIRCRSSATSFLYATLKYGTVFDLSEARRRLETDKEYRREFGYVAGIPSLSVFRNISVEMVSNWERFMECLLSPEEMKVLFGSAFQWPCGE